MLSLSGGGRFCIGCVRGYWLKRMSWIHERGEGFSDRPHHCSLSGVLFWFACGMLGYLFGNVVKGWIARTTMFVARCYSSKSLTKISNNAPSLLGLAPASIALPQAVTLRQNCATCKLLTSVLCCHAHSSPSHHPLSSKSRNNRHLLSPTMVEPPDKNKRCVSPPPSLLYND
jgi:hypothetical protein